LDGGTCLILICIFGKMEHSSAIQKPALSSRTFWDTRLDTFDFERYANFAIIRVFDRGLKNEMREIIRYYGKEKTVQALINARMLTPRAFVISKRLFHIPQELYACLKQKPLLQNY
jgi:Zn-dependent peptidase ImmA (M78 family)